MPERFSPGDWGPCIGCGCTVRRYGPGGHSACYDCDSRPDPTACYGCGRTDARPHVNRWYCPDCWPTYTTPFRPFVRQRPLQRQQQATHTPPRPAATPQQRRKACPPATWTHHPDGRVSFGATLDAPLKDSWLPHPKPCSRCRTPSPVGTVRGRAVHPCCEGQFTRLSDTALVDLTWQIATVIPIAEITELTEE